MLEKVDSENGETTDGVSNCYVQNVGDNIGGGGWGVGGGVECVY